MSQLNQIAKKFAPDTDILAIHPIGNGLINDTYLISTPTVKWILQKINPQVFHHPQSITHNLLQIQHHLETQPQPSPLIFPSLLPSIDGNYLYQEQTEKCFWRALEFVHPSESREQLSSLSEARSVGTALGQFHRMIAGLPPQSLEDTLPGFHIAPGYLEDYRHTLETHPTPQITSTLLSDCMGFIETHHNQISVLEDAKNQGLLKNRIIHGDPKLNNFLFAPDSPRIISLIDLDTIKPGLVHYDIGDCLRSCCHSYPSNTFNDQYCQEILQGYLLEAREFFTEEDFAYLYPAIWLIPFELGIRFLTDHLRGNIYFKTQDSAQNLRRAHAQFQLCTDIQQKRPFLEKLTDQLQRSYRT
jgi:Ser/Thr protein kinase RdoA (MazF antagonist)